MKITWIEANILAASGIPLDEKDIRSLHAQGIRAILTLTERSLTSLRSITPQLAQELDITLLHVPVVDNEPPSLEQAHEIVQLLQTMADQSRPVLLHCHAGIGRTGTALHLYYLAQGLTFDEAHAKVRQKRVESTLLSPTQKTFLLGYSKQ